MTDAIRAGLLDLQINESKKARKRSGNRTRMTESAPARLAEDYEHWAKKNYPNIFGAQAGPSGKPDPRAEREVNDKLVELAKLDPTIDSNATPDAILKAAQGAYMPWIIRCMKNSSYDDVMGMAHEYRDQLSAFDDLKKRNRLPSDKKDVMRYKTLNELMSMLQGLGGGFEDDDEGAVASDFKQDIQDIRGLLCRLCRMQDRDIDASIQKWDDVMNYIGGNSKWEIWEAKNHWATMIFDRWGAGAGWCVGGMLGNNWGLEQERQAKSYFSHYNEGGATYVCIQQTDKSAPRPTNKYLITLGPNGTEPSTGAGYQFHDANNHAQYIDGERGNEAELDAFGAFLLKEGLWDIFKASKFSKCEIFTLEDNKRRLEAGEPYEYAGGSIRGVFKPMIKDIKFTDTRGKERIVSAVEHPELLNFKTIEMMTVATDLIDGKPYVYLARDGHTFVEPAEIRKLVTAVVVPDSYSYKVKWAMYGPDGSEVITHPVGIPNFAFSGCDNLRKVVLSANVKALRPGWILTSGASVRGASYMDGFNRDIEIEVHGKRISVAGAEQRWFLSHAKLVEGPVPDPREGVAESLSEAVPAAVGRGGALTAGEDLNSRLLAKIDVLSSALARELEKHGFGDDLDPELVKQDMIRDCGLMGDVVSTAELDVENNPFDAETKRMHDEMPVDPQMAAAELLRVSPEEFTGRIISGLMMERRAIAAGRGRLGGPHGMIGGGPRRIGRR